VTRRIAIPLALIFLLGACAQTLTYESAAPGTDYQLKERHRFRGWPFIGSGEVDREAKLLPGPAFMQIHQGSWERVSCWRLQTRDGETRSGLEWTIEAVLADHVILRQRETLFSRVIDAEDLERIEADTEFDLLIHGHPFRITQATREKGRRRIVDINGVEHHPVVGEILYKPPKLGPPDRIYGFHKEGNAFPMDFDLMRGFMEGLDTSTVILGKYETYPVDAIARWEFDKEWGPWSVLLAPYLGGRWLFSNRDLYQRCDTFP
jgi:hypothetical protein